jgi:KaiC/GvpD/RAD55 family RecA-like ATPase
VGLLSPTLARQMVRLPAGNKGDSVTFVPLLDKLYDHNDKQISAISKALSENTITTILGPPGTGKTAVIAEIASQIASRGQRVLISSQSNLAVDNALERVLESDRIFRIRVGRPEAVKFNGDLLSERASDRYREKLLDKSSRAFGELKTKLSSVVIKSVEEVESLCVRVRAFTEIRKNHERAVASLASAREVGLRSVLGFRRPAIAKPLWVRQDRPGEPRRRRRTL